MYKIIVKCKLFSCDCIIEEPINFLTNLRKNIQNRRNKICKANSKLEKKEAASKYPLKAQIIRIK